MFASFPTFCTVAHLQRLALFPSAHTFAFSLSQKSPVALCHWPAGVSISLIQHVAKWPHLMPGDSLQAFRSLRPISSLVEFPQATPSLCSSLVMTLSALDSLVSLYISVSSVELQFPRDPGLYLYLSS